MNRSSPGFRIASHIAPKRSSISTKSVAEFISECTPPLIWHPGGHARKGRGEIAPIATEQFITAHTCQRHFHMLMGELGYKIGHKERCVGQWLVQLVQKVRHQVRHLGMNDQRLMLCAQLWSNGFGVRCFIMVRMPLIKPDAVGSYAICCHPPHECDNCA